MTDPGDLGNTPSRLGAYGEMVETRAALGAAFAEAKPHLGRDGRMCLNYEAPLRCEPGEQITMEIESITTFGNAEYTLYNPERNARHTQYIRCNLARTSDGTAFVFDEAAESTESQMRDRRGGEEHTIVLRPGHHPFIALTAEIFNRGAKNLDLFAEQYLQELKNQGKEPRYLPDSACDDLVAACKEIKENPTQYLDMERTEAINHRAPGEL